MTSIPGLSLCPVDDEDKGQGIEVEGFNGVSVIPESHRYGNCRLLSDFIRCGTISEGEFGIIYKCKEKRTDQLYALKKYKMPVDWEDGLSAAIIREINILSNLKHNNIVNSHGTIAGKKIESNYLMLDYYIISLEQLIEKGVASLYDSEVVKHLMRQLLLGLGFIHEGLIIHRDINCNNIVFAEDGTLKITEFKTARFYSKGNMTPKVTELTYRAPELLFQSKRYDTSVDIWSTGCVFAKLLLKKPIFTGSTEMEVLKSIQEILGKPSESVWPGFDKMIQLKDDFMNLNKQGDAHALMYDMISGLSIGSKELLQDFLVYYPGARMTANNALKSSYFREPPSECSCESFKSILDRILDPTEPMDLAE